MFIHWRDWLMETASTSPWRHWLLALNHLIPYPIHSWLLVVVQRPWSLDGKTVVQLSRKKWGNSVDHQFARKILFPHDPGIISCHRASHLFPLPPVIRGITTTLPPSPLNNVQYHIVTLCKWKLPSHCCFFSQLEHSKQNEEMPEGGSIWLLCILFFQCLCHAQPPQGQH